MLAVDHPWLLSVLLLAILPLLNNGVRISAYPNCALLPQDGLSLLYSGLLKLIAILAVSALVLGLAGLHQRQYWLEKIGHGANIVMLFDRSNSMDHTFAGKAPGGGEESKASAARRLLVELVKRREQDRIGVALYSTSPMYALPLTENKQAVIAAINATDTPALAYTNISKGLAMALSYYQASTEISGSKSILLVSDGAAAIDADNERKLRQWFKQYDIRLYWVFLRGKNTPGIFERPQDPRDDNAQARPERYLHLFFKSLGIAYQAYEAENPKALKQAIADIDRLENLPLHYREEQPRKDLDRFCYGLATLFISLLLGSKWLEVKL